MNNAKWKNRFVLLQKTELSAKKLHNDGKGNPFHCMLSQGISHNSLGKQD